MNHSIDEQLFFTSQDIKGSIILFFQQCLYNAVF